MDEKLRMNKLADSKCQMQQINLDVQKKKNVINFIFFGYIIS